LEYSDEDCPIPEYHRIGGYVLVLEAAVWACTDGSLAFGRRKKEKKIESMVASRHGSRRDRPGQARTAAKARGG
jgi:hypothetical protein